MYLGKKENFIQWFKSETWLKMVLWIPKHAHGTLEVNSLG